MNCHLELHQIRGEAESQLDLELRNVMMNHVRRVVLMGVVFVTIMMMAVSLSWATEGLDQGLNRPVNYALKRVETADLIDHFQAGVESFQNYHSEAAIAHFTQAIEQDNQVAAAYSNRCLVHLVADHYVEAIADCSTAIQQQPDYAESYLNRGLAYYRLGNYAEAIANYDQLLMLQPDDYRAFYNRGLAQFALHQYLQAIADYDQSLSHSPTLPDRRMADIYDDRGIAYLHLGHHQAAIANFTQAIQLDDHNARAYFNRACVCHQQGNYIAALDDIDRVLQLVPDYAQAYVSRGLLRHSLGQAEDAVADLWQAAQQFARQGDAIARDQTLELLKQIQLGDRAIV